MANTKNSVIESERVPSWQQSDSAVAQANAPVNASVRLFYVAWYGINILLVLSILLALYAFSWELSTRRYLKGFSDAIVPASAPTEEKIQSVLAWMAHGPTRLPYGPSPNVPDRDPTDTLNYDALLQVCGTATNAFINLMNTGNVPVRRLLLVDGNHNAKHVVAEVNVDGRWIIVDPAYRLVLRDGQGRTVTREEMTNPATFSDITVKIPRYDPNYTFDRTEHVRLPRIPLVGTVLRDFLNRVAPTWSDSPVATLLVERESYAAAIASVLFVIFLVVARVLLRWFGEHRLHLQLLRARYQFQRSVIAFFNA
jgi:hypothetical protein